MFPIIMLSVILSLGGVPTPQAETSPAPVDPASSAPLRDIGRTRAAVPSCTALHDVVAPAYFTMRRADDQFRDLSGNLFKYVESLDGPSSRVAANTTQATIAERSMYLHRMAALADQMSTNIDALQKALNDPRLSKDSADAKVREQRTQIEQLRDVQTGRLSLLRSFINGEQATVDTLDAATINSDPGTMHHPLRTGGHPDPDQSPPPTFTGVAIEDQAILKKWYTGLSGFVMVHEDAAVKSMLSVSEDCNAKK